MRAAVLALALAGCNSILGNDPFRGPSGDDGGGDDAGAGPDACMGIGCMVTNCAAQGKSPTSISGTVFAPDGALPLANAMVYVPTTALDPLGDGPASRACASGHPAVRTLTDVNGRFHLERVPTVPDLPVVIQVGKWRRELTVATVADCSDTVLPAAATRLPRNSIEGHVPHIALVAGAAESLECVLRSLGVSDAAHNASTGPGRIHVYKGTSSIMTMPGGAALQNVDVLYGRMMEYDQLLFSCDGQAITRAPAVQQFLLDYVTAGGWAWLTHYHSNWISAPTPFPVFAQFNTAAATPPPQVTARIDTTTPRTQAFSAWMTAVGASPQPDLVVLRDSRNTCTTADATTQRLVFFQPAISDNLSGVELFSWTAPGGNNGRVLFSDIHTQQPVSATMFPLECGTAAPLTPNDKSIAYQLFDQPVCLE